MRDSATSHFGAVSDVSMEPLGKLSDRHQFVRSRDLVYGPNPDSPTHVTFTGAVTR